MTLNAATVAEIRRINGPVLIVRRLGRERVHAITRDLVSVGRGAGSDVVLDDPEVADRHLVIQKREAGFELFSLSSAHKTMRNGTRVEAAPVTNGDDIRCGGATLTFVDPTADVLPPVLQLLFSGMPATLAPVAAPETKHDAFDTFNEALVDALKRTPWLLVSAALHAAIFLTLRHFAEQPEEPELIPTIEVDMAQIDEVDSEEELLEEPEIEDIPDLLEELPEVDIDDASPPLPEESPEDDPTLGEEELGLGDNFGNPFGADGRGYGDSVGGQGSLRGAGEKTRRTVGRLRASGLDIVFVIDATGSMDGEIESAKRRVADMIALIESADIEFRLGVVAFRDDGEQFLVKSEPLSRNRYKAVGFIDDLRAGGGGDTPEAILDGLKAAARMRWSRKAERVIVLVGDAPPHDRDRRATMDLVDRFSDKGRVHTVFAQSEYFGAETDQTRQDFREIAQRGRGSAVELKKEEHLVEEILMATLDTGDRAEVRRLVKGIEDGVKSKIVQRRIAKRDLDFVRKQLRAEGIDPVVPLALLRAKSEAFLPVYLEVLRDRKVPLPNRWLATVLLRRMLRFIDKYRDIGDAARTVLDEFQPELTYTRQKSMLTKLARALYDEGLLKTLPE